MPDLETQEHIEEAARDKLSLIRASTASIESYLAKPNFQKFSKFFTTVSGITRKVRNQSEPAFDPIAVLNSHTNTIMAEVDNLELILEQSSSYVESLLRQSSIDLETIRRIWYVREKKKRVILFLAPFYNESRLRDGYFRRIQAIDEIVGENCLKVYVTPVNYVLDETNHESFPDATHLDLKLDFEDPEEAKIIGLIADMSDLIYYHSVAFVNSTTLNLEKVQILDLHGSVPEELMLQDNPEQAMIENEKEKLALEKVNYAIVVSRAMATHLQEKYLSTKVKYITLPILDSQTTHTKQYLDPKPYLEGKPFVAYVGGMQKWQLIPRMQSLIDLTHHLYNYQILVPAPDEFLLYWKETEIPPISVRSGDREAVKQVCEKAHYGLLLREEIVVNKVSCPTKLIEYLAYGVVPVRLVILPP
jgi:hypothetical protein